MNIEAVDQVIKQFTHNHASYFSLINSGDDFQDPKKLTSHCSHISFIYQFHNIYIFISDLQGLTLAFLWSPLLHELHTNPTPQDKN